MDEIIRSGPLVDFFNRLQPFPICIHDHRSKLSEGTLLDLKDLLEVWGNEYTG